MKDRLARILGLAMAAVCAWTANGAQTNLIYFDIGDYGQAVEANVNVTITLISPNPRVEDGIFIRRDSMTDTTRTNGRAYFTNLLWGYYRADVAGRSGTPFYFNVWTNTTGTVNAGTLRTNAAALPPDPSTNYYTMNQIDLLIAGIDTSGGTATNVLQVGTTNSSGIIVGTNSLNRDLALDVSKPMAYAAVSGSVTGTVNVATYAASSGTVTGTVAVASYATTAATATNMDASGITSGTLDDDRLSANIARVDLVVTRTDGVSTNQTLWTANPSGGAGVIGGQIGDAFAFANHATRLLLAVTPHTVAFYTNAHFFQDVYITNGILYLGNGAQAVIVSNTATATEFTKNGEKIMELQSDKVGVDKPINSITPATNTFAGTLVATQFVGSVVGNATAATYSGNATNAVLTNRVALSHVWKKYGTVLRSTTDAEHYALQEPWVLRDTRPQLLTNETTVFKMWYTMAAGVSPATAYAESADGLTWTKHPNNPVATNFYRVGIITNGTDYWNYSHGELHHSTNGIDWGNATSVLPWNTPDTNAWDAAIYHQIVWQEGTNWYMLYQGGTRSGVNIYASGLATSTNGTNWTRYAGNPVLASSTGGSIAAECVHKIGDTYWLWCHEAVNGVIPTELSRFYSTNLTNWVRSPQGFSLERSSQDEYVGLADGQLANASLLEVGGKSYLYYCSARNNFGHIKLAVADMPIATLVQTGEGMLTSHASLELDSVGGGIAGAVPWAGSDGVVKVDQHLTFDGTNLSVVSTNSPGYGAHVQLRLSPCSPSLVLPRESFIRSDYYGGTNPGGMTFVLPRTVATHGFHFRNNGGDAGVNGGDELFYIDSVSGDTRSYGAFYVNGNLTALGASNWLGTAYGDGSNLTGVQTAQTNISYTAVTNAPWANTNNATEFASTLAAVGNLTAKGTSNYLASVYSPTGSLASASVGTVTFVNQWNAGLGTNLMGSNVVGAVHTASNVAGASITNRAGGLTAGASIAAANGSALTNLSASNLASGIVPDARLTNSALLNGNNVFTGSSTVSHLYSTGAQYAKTFSTETNYTFSASDTVVFVTGTNVTITLPNCTNTTAGRIVQVLVDNNYGSAVVTNANGVQKLNGALSQTLGASGTATNSFTSVNTGSNWP